MYAKGLQLIPLSHDRFVLKRGIHELLVSGPTVRAVIEPLVAMLDGTRSREQLLAVFSGDLRPEADQLLTALVKRGLVFGHATQASVALVDDSLQAAFYDNFGPMGQNAPERLRRATVLIVGVNLIARALVRGLLECGVGKVMLVEHPILSNHVAPFPWTTGIRDNGSPAFLPQTMADRLVLCDELPDDTALRDVSLMCATSDFGEAEALLQVNRLALRVEKVFLPIWLTEMRGYVGPLNYPHETACLRCYHLRADSNNPRYEIGRAIRKHITNDLAARQTTGFLSPMPSVLGEIATMEVVKCLGEFVPSDTVGRLIEINLVAFSSAVRRVLKIPRCPDCSDQTVRAPMALTRGPQIPQRG